MAAVAGMVVVGPVAVLPLKAGGERYVYRSAAVQPVEPFTEAGVAHAVAAGLVELVKVEPEKQQARKPAAKA